jgi:type IV pilus assembly protein PilW
MRNTHLMHRSRTQRGFTLLELMVAMVLGLMLMAVAIQIFIGNRDIHRFNNNLARVQENGRFAFGQIARVVRMTGYQGDSAAAWVLGPMSLVNGGVTALAGTDNATNGSDTFTLAYQGAADNFIKDCHGADVPTVPIGSVVTNTYALDAGNQLTCAVSLNGAAAVTLPVIDGVEAMHVLYGLDTDDDDAANQYVTAGNVADMEDVVSMRVSLLLRTLDDNLIGVTDTGTYAILDETVDPVDDRRLRRVFTTTINLRNRL